MVEAYLGAVSAADADAAAALLADGALIFDPVGDAAVEGPEGVRALIADRADRYSLFERRLGVLHARDDGAAFTWTGRTRRTPGPVVEFSGIDVVEVDEAGRLRTVWSYWDPEGLDAAGV